MKVIFLLPSLNAYGTEIVFELANRLEEEVLITSLDKPVKVDWFPLKNNPISYAQAVKEFETADAIIATYAPTAYLLNDLDVKAKKFYLVLEQESKFYTDELWKAKYPNLPSKRLEIEKRIQTNYLEGALDLPLRYLATSRGLSEFLKIKHKKRATHIPIGVNQKLFYPDSGIPKGDVPRILVSGSELPWKGTMEVSYVLSDARNIEIWTTSDSKSCIKSLKHWKNPSVTDLRRILSSCDILVNVPWHSGNALLEAKAMACGCAVLATKTKGTRDFLIHKENAYLVPPNKPEKIKEGLAYLLDKENRKTLIRGGISTAEALNWDAAVKILNKTLKRR